MSDQLFAYKSLREATGVIKGLFTSKMFTAYSVVETIENKGL
jgi:hypothetical protein